MDRNETTTDPHYLTAVPNVAVRVDVAVGVPVDAVIISDSSSSTSSTTTKSTHHHHHRHLAAASASVDQRRPPPPMGIDEASWNLIQQLQAHNAEQDDEDDNNDSTSSIEIIETKRSLPPRRYKDGEDDNYSSCSSSSSGGSVEIIEPPPLTKTRHLTLWDVSITSLKRRLEQCGVSTDHMIEKDELVTALETAQATGFLDQQPSSSVAAGSSSSVNFNKYSPGEKRKRGQNQPWTRSKIELDDEQLARQLQREENDKYRGDAEGFNLKDEEVARKIQHDEDEYQRRLQEEQHSMGLAAAWALQQEEDYKNQKDHRHRQMSKEQVLKSLKSCQVTAVDDVKTKAKAMHDAALSPLEKRVVRLGFTVDDLKECLVYIRDDAPIVIHLTAATLSLLVQDTHYRNQFETNTSGGTNDQLRRAKWEQGMFGPCYNGMDGALRPKYGCLNVSGDIAGVKSARNTYGPLVLTLQAHTRYRSTFFNKDTAGVFSKKACGETLATNEYYAHVLNGYNDTELKAVIHVCQSARVGGAASHCNEYKEVQIHGLVTLATDIQALSIPGRARGATRALQKDVEEFQKKTGCAILWQQDILDPEDE